MRIGIDFDNTIVRYDDVFVTAAIERGLLPPGFVGSKQAVRDTIRTLPDGEPEWQRLQGHVYGKGIAGASAFPGLDEFLLQARRRSAHVVVVSHKTEYGHFDPERVNLRQAAVDWMESQSFFAENGFGLRREDIHFGATRPEKLALISELRCDLFVDDLREVLDDPDFPPFVTRILFSTNPAGPGAAYRVCPTWQAISRVVFE